MSTAYNGKPSALIATANLTKSIASSTNATPIVVTTTTAHGLADGDFVQVAGHAVNVTANGIRAVTYLSPTTFALVDPSTGAAIAGVGVGVATGDVIPFNTATLAIPDDGDAAAASSWDPAYETLADRSAYSFFRLARSGLLAQAKKVGVASVSGSAWSDNVFGSGITAFAETASQDTGLPIADLDVQILDTIEVDFSSTISVVVGTPPGSPLVRLALFACAYDYGTSPSFASASKLPGSGATLLTVAPYILPIKLRWKAQIDNTIITSLATDHGQALKIYVGVYWNFGDTGAVDFIDDRLLVSQVWR